VAGNSYYITCVWILLRSCAPKIWKSVYIFKSYSDKIGSIFYADSMYVYFWRLLHASFCVWLRLRHVLTLFTIPTRELRRANVFGRICLCLFIFSVLTFESLDLKSLFLVCIHHGIFRWGLYTKVIGSRLRSQKQTKIFLDIAYQLVLSIWCVITGVFADGLLSTERQSCLFVILSCNLIISLPSPLFVRPEWDTLILVLIRKNFLHRMLFRNIY